MPLTALEKREAFADPVVVVAEDVVIAVARPLMVMSPLLLTLCGVTRRVPTMSWSGWLLLPTFATALPVVLSASAEPV